MNSGTLIFSLISCIIAIIGSVLGVVTFFSNKRKEAVQQTKENHQELIEYQLKEIKEDNKEIKNDLKEIRRTLNVYKDTFRDMIVSELSEHVRLYHSKEK